MCLYSMIADDFSKTVPDRFPNINEWIQIQTPVASGPTREEFESLKREIEALKQLLIQAKIYDKVTNQPDCEKEDKVALLKKIAQLVGVNLEDALQNG